MTPGTAAIWKATLKATQVTTMHGCIRSHAYTVTKDGWLPAPWWGRVGGRRLTEQSELSGWHWYTWWWLGHTTRWVATAKPGTLIVSYVPILYICTYPTPSWQIFDAEKYITGHYIFVPEGTVWRYLTEYVTIEDEANNTRLYRSTILHFCTGGYGLTHEGTEHNTVLKQLIRDYKYLQTNNTRIIILSMNESGWSETLFIRKSMHKYANMNIHSWKRIILDT